MSAHKVKSQVKVKKSKSTSGNEDDVEHELFHYANDRVRLMKEVLKLIKPNKIKAIAPDFIRNLDVEEVNSLLLEELLGISNKRLKSILNGTNVDDESSSADSEDEQKPIDIISLDDISDTDDDTLYSESAVSKSKGKKNKNIRTLRKNKNFIKEEKTEEKDKLMTVLEILELQARARAIRSQLALENVNKKQPEETKTLEDSDGDAVIVHSPKNEEIVISSSESENELQTDDKIQTKTVEEQIKDISDENEANKIQYKQIEKESESVERSAAKNEPAGNCKKKEDKTRKKSERCNSFDDAVIINLDAVEIEEIES